MAAHKSRSILQAVGIILGVASVVATFGLIDSGGPGPGVLRQDGRHPKMFVREQGRPRAAAERAARGSQGPHLRRRAAIAAQATTLELVEPTMERHELVKRRASRSGSTSSGATPSYGHVRLPPGRGPLPHRGGPGAQPKVVVLGSTRREEIFGGRPASASRSASAATATRWSA